MKKLYPIFLFFFLSAFVSGQTFISEDFSSGIMPPTGWTIDNLAAQWSIGGGNNAGGTAPEAVFTYINQNTYSRLVSPSVDLTGFTTVTLMFTHMYDDYTGAGPVVGVATRSAGGPWTSVWEINPTSNVGPINVILNISNSDIGQSDFQFCFYINGNLYNVDYWYIDDIMLFNPPALDLALTSAVLPSYLATNTPVDLTGKVKNLGLANITSFDVNYTIDGGTPAVYSVTGQNLALGQSYDYTHNIPVNLADPGTYAINVYISNVNGGNDDNQLNDTILTHVGVVPWLPAKKVFAEEATGTWCGYCVRGICYMDYMAETYPEDWIAVAVHNGDPMVVPDYDNAIPNIIPNFPGYPSGTIDRSGGNYYDPEQFEEGYLDRINAISPGSIGIFNFSYDPGTRLVSFDLQSEFVIDVYNELRFCAVISEDSLWGTSGDWAQENYYSGGSLGPMCGFEDKPATIPAADMHYDHVARAILDTPYGTPGSLPVPVSTGEIYSYTYTLTLPSDWIFEKLHFIGLLMDHTTGEVLNANNVVSWVGLSEHSREISLAVYPNPFNAYTTIGFTLDKPEKVGMTVTDLLGRTVYTEPAKNFAAGENKIQLNGENLDNGFYLVQLTIGAKTYTQKVSVSK